MLKHLWFILPLFLFLEGATTAFSDAPHTVPANRVASIYVSRDFINEQLTQHIRSELVQKMTLSLDSEHDQIFLRGALHIPIEELRAINLNPKLGKFLFQMAIKLSTTKHGHLIIEFPLEETFFYAEDSKNPKRDRIVVPVQLLSVALASVRGYLAALSGDFAGFDRQTQKLEALMKSLEREISLQKNADALDDLKTRRESLRLQLAAMPIERKQLQTLSKEFESMLGFTGEKELSLNDELAARENSLILKIKLSQLTPYLQGVELGGVRIVHDKKDGAGEDYLAIDVNAQLNAPAGAPSSITVTPKNRAAMKVAPSLIMRLNQSLFESEAVVSAEKKELGSNMHDFNIEFKDDGLHVTGKARALLVFSVGFEVIVDFVTTGTDVFEARVREMKVAGMNLEFLAKFALETLKSRLDKSLKGICSFKYVGEESDHSRALQVTVNSKQLVPAFPDLHLVEVDVREREFLLKIGRP